MAIGRPCGERICVCREGTLCSLAAWEVFRNSPPLASADAIFRVLLAFFFLDQEPQYMARGIDLQMLLIAVTVSLWFHIH